MLNLSVAVGDSPEAHNYLQDDVFRGLRTSLASVLSAVQTADQVSPGYLKGVLALARSQASLYGIPWCDLLADLCDGSELGNLVVVLQDGSRGL